MSDVVERLLAGAGGGKHWMELHTEAANEIKRLREIERLYDEAAGQEAVGYVDIDMDNFYTFEEWPCYVPDDDNRQGIYPAYIKPVPQAMAVPDGWKLVPINATTEMVRVMKDRLGVTSRGGLLNAGNALNAAIAAAPKQEEGV